MHQLKIRIIVNKPGDSVLVQTTSKLAPNTFRPCFLLFRLLNREGVHSRVLSVHLFVAPWTVARQAPLFLEFSRQEHWSGLPLPTSGDLPVSPA